METFEYAFDLNFNEDKYYAFMVDDPSVFSRSNNFESAIEKLKIEIEHTVISWIISIHIKNHKTTKRETE